MFQGAGYLQIGLMCSPCMHLKTGKPVFCLGKCLSSYLNRVKHFSQKNMLSMNLQYSNLFMLWILGVWVTAYIFTYGTSVSTQFFSSEISFFFEGIDHACSTFFACTMLIQACPESFRPIHLVQQLVYRLRCSTVSCPSVHSIQT
jgi:hypothetical protein